MGRMGPPAILPKVRLKPDTYVRHPKVRLKPDTMYYAVFYALARFPRFGAGFADLRLAACLEITRALDRTSRDRLAALTGAGEVSR